MIKPVLEGVFHCRNSNLGRALHLYGRRAVDYLTLVVLAIVYDDRLGPIFFRLLQFLVRELHRFW